MALPPNRGGIPPNRPRITGLPKAPSGPPPRNGTPGEVYAVVQKAVSDVVSKSLSPLHRQMGLILQQQRQLSVALGAIVQVLKAKGVLTQKEIEVEAEKLVAEEMKRRAAQAKPEPGAPPPAATAAASSVGRGDAHHDEHLNAGFHDPECVACLKIVDRAPVQEQEKAEEPKAAHGVQSPPVDPVPLPASAPVEEAPKGP